MIRWRIGVVSPHADDAALSIAATLAALAERGHALHLVTCFSESTYAPYASANQVRGAALRLAEDRAYARSLGPRARNGALGFLDAPLRCPGRPLLGETEPRDHDEASKLAPRLRRKLREADLLLAPVGILHIDHRVTHAAAVLAFAPERLGFYEDRPYAVRIGTRDIRRALSFACLVDITIAPKGWRTMRMSALDFYRSQIGACERDELTTGMSARPGERLWLPPGIYRRFVELVGTAAVVRSQGRRSCGPSPLPDRAP